MASKVKSCDVFYKINIDFQALSPALQSSIKKIIEKEHFAQYEVAVKDLNTHGNNFLGKLYEISIKCITSECEKDINIFVKQKIIAKKLTMFSLERLYVNEEFMYKDFSEIIVNLQHRVNVPPDERFKMAKAYAETSSDAIILENLGRKGFITYDRAEPVPLRFFELGVQELAKMHALSFVIENKLPEYFKKKIAVLENPLNFDEDWNRLMRNICRYVADLYDDKTRTKIENFLPVLLEKLPKYHKDKTSVCTLSHGDYRKANIMARIVDGEPVEVIAIDYQFISYGCPMRDFLYFIFLETDQEFRRKHLNYLKELYYETFSRFLTYFDMDVEAVYPRKQFEKIFTEWLDFGLMMVLFVSVFQVAPPETGLNVENLSISEFPYCPNTFFENRLKELINDFVQWGYL